MTVYLLGGTKEKTFQSKSISAFRGENMLSKSSPAGMHKFYLFWDLMDTVEAHGYLRASMSIIGRSTIGTWWKLVENQEALSAATARKKNRLYRFYNFEGRSWDNIKDFQTLAHKFLLAAMYLRYFGQAAFYIVRNKEGVAIGLDTLYGFIQPNVDSEGYFKSPAFYQYPTRNPSGRVAFEDPRDIVFITNPDWNGYPSGGTDIESLSQFALPTDIYLQTIAREYLKNRDRPEHLYILPSDISDEAFNDFSNMIATRYAGPKNVGKAPIVVQGDLEVKELSKMPADLPYQEARTAAREEVLSVSGVSGAKLGLTNSLSSANFREARREFHETEMLPLFTLIEQGFNEQIHLREFGIKGWLFKFNNPDFLTAVEKATVHMRYHNMGVLNPNEIRLELGRRPREDEQGNAYIDPAPNDSLPGGEQGSPPEGREDNPDSPSHVGEPTLDDQDPPRGDQHDEEGLLLALRDWEQYSVSRIRRGKGFRKFYAEEIPACLSDAIQAQLEKAGTIQEVRNIFSEVRSLIEEEEINA
jgi:hypothetical protein